MEEKQNNVNMGVEGDGGSNGLVIATIVIIVIIILGGLYFWNQRAGNDAVVDEINTQNNSDESSAIEADLNATDIESLDAELNAS
ncbi:MAG: hypothetical protein Q8Q22_01740 [bacterium]|nr:hypothetical protein [bacterium]MDZ4205918.1 hypothetical protein [Patescibacteria group bacterium]